MWYLQEAHLKHKEGLRKVESEDMKKRCHSNIIPPTKVWYTSLNPKGIDFKVTNYY